MSQKTELRLPVPHQGVEHVHAVLDAPEGAAPRAAFVLAHGSGAPLSSDFLEAVAPAIADTAGLAVLRFNYGYAELMIRSGKPRPPERRPALEVVHRAAIAHARTVLPELPVILGGKSLGGRIASLMVAEGEPAAGLCFLGYPLHPPGKKDRQRTDHFPGLEVPALFVQGTRDPLCDLTLLEAALPSFAGRPTVCVIEDGDHSFNVLKRSGRAPSEVIGEIAAAVATWADEVI